MSLAQDVAKELGIELRVLFIQLETEAGRSLKSDELADAIKKMARQKRLEPRPS